MYTRLLTKWRAQEQEEAKALFAPRKKSGDGRPHTTPGALNRSRSSPWVLPAGSGLEERHNVFLALRQKLNAAKRLRGLTWEVLFMMCDTDGSGELDWKEFKSMVRETLGVSEQTACEVDLRSLFSHVQDSVGNGSSAVDLGDMLQYLARGPVDKEVENARKTYRVQRVKRNIQMAFLKLNTHEDEVRKMFNAIDLDGNSCLSLFEFESFIRGSLNLTNWDVLSSDLEAFYLHLDRDGKGINADTFLDYVKKVNIEKKDFGVETSRKDPTVPEFRMPTKKKWKSYKDNLLEDIAKTRSAKNLQDMTMPFVATGRRRPPANRFTASGMKI
eukprot:TRINITY_DN66319_c0_g1_i1.p1 TRINITY_DN66319_c0_g1~~TRINITY_DN66319_c0_g1_i1.p1  ORF type:complete len:329 (-),score=53.69 TRINITY_DN66319_c0_g1_i1:46-1032(-)